MSHFTVLVIGEDVEGQLEKYSENADKATMDFVSTETEERQKYESDGTEVIVLADGSWKFPFDQSFKTDKFFGNPTYPEGSEKVKRTYKELYPSFEEYMETYCGYSERDEEHQEYGYWTNPNAKWDWWTVGGRWMGFFKLKPGATGELGQAGAFDNEAPKGCADSLMVKDIDFELMRKEVAAQANQTYDEIEAILQGNALPSWKKALNVANQNVNEARNIYNAMPSKAELDKKHFCLEGYEEEFGPNREAYVQRCIQGVGVPFAIVKDGQWIERGKMHMFAVTSDEMPYEDWVSYVNNLYDELAPETKVTLVDCHC